MTIRRKVSDRSLWPISWQLSSVIPVASGKLFDVSHSVEMTFPFM